MCDPVTAAVVIAGVAVAGAGVAAYGSYQQASAYKKTAKAQAAIADNNRVIAERQAADRIAQGKQEERNYRSRLEVIKGQQRSNFAGSGVVVDSDTPFEILGETAQLGELDAMAIRNNAAREAYGFKVQAMNFGAQSSIYTATAKNTHPWFNATNTFLGGLTGSAGAIAPAAQSGGGAGAGGAAAGAGGAGAGAAAAASDENLKENIVSVGKSPSGFNIIEFNYKRQPSRRYRGVSAQELLNKRPDAVIEKDGKLSVDYSKIDVKFKEVRYGN